MRAESVGRRRPGLSVRLKLTLSYAGFLMGAGALLLFVVWVFLLRGTPATIFAVPHVSDVARAFDPSNFGPSVFASAAFLVIAFLLRYLRVHDFALFLWIRVAVAALILLVIATGTRPATI